MAVTQYNQKRKLWIKVNNGTVSDPTYTNRTIGSGYCINTQANNATMYALADAFSNLQQHTLESVQFDDVYSLREGV